VSVRRTDLAPGTPITVILSRGKGRISSWQVTVGRGGSVTARVPGRIPGTVILMSDGIVIGVLVLRGA